MTPERRAELVAELEATQAQSEADFAEWVEQVEFVRDGKVFDPPVGPDTTPDPEGDRE